MKSSTIGSKIIELNTIDSTNNYGISLLNKGKIEEGTVILAKSQTSGKGLNGNYWESEKNKNITVSIILYPYFLPVEWHFMLNVFTALAVYDLIDVKVGDKRTYVKWPNDIYIDNKKVAGILIKNAIKGNIFEYSLLGLGININQLEFKSNAPNPVSIRHVTNINYDIHEVLDELCLYLDNRYKQLKNGELDELKKDYQRSLLFFNEFKMYEYKKDQIEAKITGVSRGGKLMLETKEGTKISCEMKEIVYLF